MFAIPATPGHLKGLSIAEMRTLATLPTKIRYGIGYSGLLRR